MPSQPVAAKKEVKDNAPKGAADENAAPAADTKKKAAPAPVSIEPPAPPVDRQIVAVVNGSSLYLLDRRDGRPHMDVKHQQGWKIRLKSGAPGAGPLVTDDKVFVPTAAAQLEVYSIDNIAEAQGVL